MKNAKRLQEKETVTVNKVFPRREKNNGGNRRSCIIAVNRVVMCPVLANFRTL